MLAFLKKQVYMSLNHFRKNNTNLKNIAYSKILKIKSLKNNKNGYTF